MTLKIGQAVFVVQHHSYYPDTSHVSNVHVHGLQVISADDEVAYLTSLEFWPVEHVYASPFAAHEAARAMGRKLRDEGRKVRIWIGETPEEL